MSEFDADLPDEVVKESLEPLAADPHEPLNPTEQDMIADLPKAASLLTLDEVIVPRKRRAKKEKDAAKRAEARRKKLQELGPLSLRQFPVQTPGDLKPSAEALKKLG